MFTSWKGKRETEIKYSIFRDTIWCCFTRTCNFNKQVHQKNLGPWGWSSWELTAVGSQLWPLSPGKHLCAHWLHAKLWLFCFASTLFCNGFADYSQLRCWSQSSVGCRLNDSRAKDFFFFFLKATVQELIWMKFCIVFSCWKCTFKSLKFSERERRKPIKAFWLNIWKKNSFVCFEISIFRAWPNLN